MVKLLVLALIIATPAQAVDTLQATLSGNDKWAIVDLRLEELYPIVLGSDRRPYVDGNGHLWQGVGKSVLRYDGKMWVRYSAADGLMDGHVINVLQAKNGTLWFLGDHQGKAAATSFDGKDWKIYTGEALTGRSMGGAWCIDDRGHIWARSEHFTIGMANTGGHGAFRFDGEKWERITKDDGLLHDRLYDLAAGQDGRIWFATRAGLGAYDGEAWTSYTVMDGLRSYKIYRVMVADDGSVWCTHGDRNGISVLTGTKWNHHTKATGMPLGRVRTMFQDRDGAMWFGTHFHDYKREEVAGLLRYKDGEWLRIGPEDGLPGKFVAGIAQTPDGALWMNLPGIGLARYDAGKEAFSAIEGLVKVRGTPKAGIIVRVTNPDGTPRASTRTNDLGRYRVDVLPGAYQVTLDLALSGKVDVTVAEGQRAQADFSPWIASAAIPDRDRGILAFTMLLIAWMTYMIVSRLRQPVSAQPQQDPAQG